MKNTPIKIKARDLAVTDSIRSQSSGEWLTVTKVTHGPKVVVILNGTMEIDFNPDFEISECVKSG